jgi:beta-phosphoglucomutase-like phosphatase (HAD superfamily)
MENNLRNKNKIKIVALDFDGVITNLKVDWNYAIRLASQITGYDIRSLLTFYETSHDTPTFYLVSREIEKIELEAMKSAEPTPFLDEFLDKIVKANAEICLVSMQSALVIEMFLMRHNLAHYFKEILTRERFSSKKTQVRYILSCSGVKPEEVILVDDSKRSIEQCKELGIRCFLFKSHEDLPTIRKMWLRIYEIIHNNTV